MIGKTFLVHRADSDVMFLIEQSHYFGETGAITYFTRKYASCMQEEIAHGESHTAMQYLAVLYFALSHVLLCGGVFSFKVVILFFKITKLLNIIETISIKKEHNVHEKQILMASYARILQVLYRSQLDNTFGTFWNKMYERFDQHYVSILQTTGSYNRESPNIDVLLVDALRYELFAEGLIAIYGAPDISENIWRYAMKNEKTNDIDTAYTVSWLFQVIGYHKDAATVHKRIDECLAV